MRFLLVIWTLFFACGYTFAYASDVGGGVKKFEIALTGSNNYQEMGTDLAFSAINGLAFVYDQNNLNHSLVYKMLSGYATFFTVLLEHEVVGHGARIKEFKGEINGYDWGLFGASTNYSDRSIKSYHIQKSAMISLGGNEVGYVLSQKLLNNAMKKNQDIDPVTASAYIFSSANQAFYVHMFRNTKKSGHDIADYVREMQLAYGDKSMTIQKVRSVGVLDFLDPMLFTSMYSFASSEDAPLPLLTFGDIGFMPAARSVLTPYGVLEKRVSAYIVTEYTPIKVSFGFGKQTKTGQSAVLTPIEYQKYRELGKLNGAKVSSDMGFFNGTDKPIKQNSTYYFDVMIGRLLSFDDLDVGIFAATWKQPELFTKDAYNAKAKQGGMFSINMNYSVSESMSLLFDAGYKTKGFMIGQPTAKTPVIRAGLSWAL